MGRPVFWLTVKATGERFRVEKARKTKDKKAFSCVSMDHKKCCNLNNPCDTAILYCADITRQFKNTHRWGYVFFPEPKNA